MIALHLLAPGRHGRPGRARHALATAAAAALLAAGARASPALAQERGSLAPPEFWRAAGAAVAVAAFADEALRTYSAEHRSRGLDRLASAGDALGTGRNLIVGMGVAYAGARLFRRRELARAVAHAAAAYTVGNVVVSVLKPAVGRHRPPGAIGPWQFRPFSAAGEWHSFPSSHAVHAFTLAAAVASEGAPRQAAIAGYGAAALVAWSRVYDGQHWASDVTATGVGAVVATRATLRWLHRWAPHDDDARAGDARPNDARALRLRPLLLPNAVGVSAAW